MRHLLEIGVTIATIGIVFIVSYTPLLSYIYYILPSILIFCLFFMLSRKFLFKKKTFFTGSYYEVFFIILIVLLIVAATEGIRSNFFFLTYFLLFGISFLFEPYIIFIFLLGLVFLFVPQALEYDLLSNFIKLGSLVLLSPIAYFFSREFKKKEHNS